MNTTVKHQSGLMTWLRLGRVSNLPTIWTNSVVGLALGGLAVLQTPASTAGSQLVVPSLPVILLVFVAMSLFYIGGMFLNDAFDAQIDALERPDRPIPSGEVTRLQVYAAGYSLLLAGIVAVWFLAGFLNSEGAWMALISAIALAFFIVLYNAWHKNNPLSPLVMGMCRVLVYTTTALLLAPTLTWVIALAAIALLAYLIGLTAIAKQENFGEVTSLWPLGFLFLPILFWQWSGSWNVYTTIYSLVLFAWTLRACQLLADRKPGNVPKAVGGMLAGISLVDGLALAALATGATSGFFAAGLSGVDIFLIVLCLLCFMLTLLLQRSVPGT